MLQAATSSSLPLGIRATLSDHSAQATTTRRYGTHPFSALARDCRLTGPVTWKRLAQPFGFLHSTPLFSDAWSFEVNRLAYAMTSVPAYVLSGAYEGY